MRRIKILFIWASLLLSLRLTARAEEVPSIPEFTQDDRVMVLAPHPDDETLGAGGAIQRALDKGAKVRVVCFTNGDHNQLAFIVYEKRFTFRTGEFLHMGELRRKETVEAMSAIGLTRNDLVFLGYPDFGTMVLLTQYWQSPKPYWSLMTRISKVSYPDALTPGAPFMGESVLKDLKSVIEDFMPTKIFVSHPADTNRDHQALYLFTRVALWDLEAKGIKPELYPYIIHVLGWPMPRGHHLNLELKVPEKLIGISWKQLPLTTQETKIKQLMVDFYKTEIEYNPPYLYSYVRKNELFGDFPEIELESSKGGAVIWHDVVLLPDYPSDKYGKEDKIPPSSTGLFYALDSKDLLIRFDLRHKTDKNLGVAINLLGYKKDVAFELMPKINIGIGLFGMRIKNKNKLISVPDARLKFEGRSLILKLPLEVLGSPDRILSRVKTRTAKFPLDASAWRILSIK